MKTLDLLTNAVRTKEIISVLVRNGFGDLLDQLGIPHRWQEHLVPDDILRKNVWERIRYTLEQLGPTFVKFGQVLSTRADILPEALINELKHLRSQVKPVPFGEIEPIMVAELNRPLEEVFSDFGREPVASGSIGQIHRATLWEDGAVVAVKVQRPNIRKAIRSDIEIISWLARKIHQKLEDLRPYDLPDVVESTGKGILEELDFSIEANNAHMFNLMNPEAEHVFAPKVHTAFTTARLTVCEWVDGIAPGDPAIPAEQGRRLAVVMGRSVFHQIMIAGFFHGDPHGGNVLVTRDGRACFVDWGLAGSLTREMRYFLADLFSAISSSEPEKVVRVATMMATGRSRLDETRLEREVSFVLRQYLSRFGHGEAIGKIVLELLYVFGSNGIKVARDYSLLAKAIISVEEVGVTLDPDFDVRPVAQPFLQKLSMERWNPINVVSQSWWNFQNQFRRVRQLPSDLQRLFHTIEDGDLVVRMRHEGLDKLGEFFDSGINRLSMALLTAASITGSAILMSATLEHEPRLFGYPTVIGTIGFLVSLVFGLWLVFNIIRHGKTRRK